MKLKSLKGMIDTVALQRWGCYWKSRRRLITGGIVAALVFLTGVWATIYIYMCKSSAFVNYEKTSLPSGWEVLFFEDKSLPYIRYSLFLPYGGSGFNPASKSGLAKFTLSLLDQGAGDWSSEEIQEKLNFYGTELDIRTGRENAKAVLSGLSFHAESLWEIFHAIILKPQFLPKEIENLKKRFTQERLRTLDDRGYTAYEAWLRTLFKDENLSRPVSGTIPSIKNLKEEDVHSFYDFYMMGQKKVLTVTGHFDDSLKNKILSSLQSVDIKQKVHDETKKRQNPLSLNLKHPASSAPAFYFLTKTDLTQSEVLIGFSMKPFPEKSHFREYIAFALGNASFGGGSLSSRLMRELREEKGLTYGIYSSRTAEREYGFFMIDGNTRTETTALFLENTLSLLKELKEKGITEKELERSKIKRKSDFLSQIETMESRSANYIHYRYGLNADRSFLDNYIKSIDEIKLEEVNEALKNLIDWEKLHILVYGHPKIKEALNKVKPITKTFSFEEYFSEELSLDKKTK